MLPGPIRRNPLVAVIVVLLAILAAGLLTRAVSTDPVVDGSEFRSTAAELVLPEVAPPVGEVGPTMREYRGRPPAEMRPRPPIDPSGLRAVDAWETASGPTTLFEAAADRLGAPTRRVEIRTEPGATPLILSPLEWGVAEDGRIVASSSVALRFLLFVSVLAGSILVGAAGAWLRVQQRDAAGYHHEYRVPYEGAVGTVCALVPFLSAWHWWFAPADAWTAAFCVVLLGTTTRNLASRLLLACRLCFLAGFAFLAQVELEAPLPALASAYGPLGVHVWDVVAVSGAMAAFLAWRISLVRFDRGVRIDVPSPPLVQDVRIVDRR